MQLYFRAIRGTSWQGCSFWVVLGNAYALGQGPAHIFMPVLAEQASYSGMINGLASVHYTQRPIVNVGLKYCRGAGLYMRAEHGWAPVLL